LSVEFPWVDETLDRSMGKFRVREENDMRLDAAPSADPITTKAKL